MIIVPIAVVIQPALFVFPLTLEADGLTGAGGVGGRAPTVGLGLPQGLALGVEQAQRGAEVVGEVEADLGLGWHVRFDARLAVLGEEGGKLAFAGLGRGCGLRDAQQRDEAAGLVEDGGGGGVGLFAADALAIPAVAGEFDVAVRVAYGLGDASGQGVVGVVGFGDGAVGVGAPGADEADH